MIFDKFIYRLLLVGVLFTAYQTGDLTVHAQADKTVTQQRVAEDETPKYEAGHKGYDALKYAMQQRYRYPDLISFSNSSFLSHFYLGGVMSYEQIAPQKGFEYTSAPMYGIVVGKDITKSHSLSLQLMYGKTPTKGDMQYSDLTRLKAQMNHHFNFTRYYLGFNPFRIFELSSTIGLGYQNYELWNKKDNSKYILFGLRGMFRIGHNVMLGIEPHIAMADKSYDMSSVDYTSNRYNVSYGVATSLMYEMRNELSGIEKTDDFVFARNYLFAGSGLQYLDTNVLLNDGVGPNFVFGYGRWLTRNFAMQLSGGYSAGTWREKKIKADKVNNLPAYKAYARSQYIYGRGELLFNLYTTAKKHTGIKNDFSVNLLGGYEYGMQWKYYPTVTNQENSYYSGFTGALNLKYHIDRGTALYLEPRLSFVKYSTPYNSPYEYIKTEENYRRYSVTLGMETAFDKKTVKSTDVDDVFLPEYAISLFGGLNYIFERTGYYGGPRAKNIFGLNVEHQPHRYWGYRVMFDYSKYGFNNILTYKHTAKKVTTQKGLWNTNYNVLSVGLDAKFDITNFLLGYSPDRRWRSAIYFGPVATKIISMDKSLSSDEPRAMNGRATTKKNYNDKLQLGLYAGINHRYNVTPLFNIFCETGLRVYNNEIFASETLDFNPVKILNFVAGVGYNFKNDINGTSDNYLFPRNYMFMGTGLQYANTNVEILDGIGPEISFGFGRWLTRRLALQISMNYATGNSSRHITAAKPAEGHPQYKSFGRTQQFLLRGEAVYNFYTTIKDRNEIKNDFSVNVIAGYERGARWDYSADGKNGTNGSYNGYTGALNFKYHINDQYSLFIEPRGTISKYEKKFCKENGNVAYRYSLLAGVEMPVDKANYKLYKKEENKFVPEYSFSLYGGVNYLVKRTLYSGCDNLDYNWGVAFGYKWNRLLGYRLNLDYTKLGFNNICRFTETLGKNKYSYKGLWNYNYHLMSLGFDFNFNITNALYGYNPDRRWSSALYVGPVASKLIKFDNKISPDELTLPNSEISLKKKYNEDVQVGVHMALNSSYALSDNFKLFTEVGARVYKNEILFGENLDYNPVKMLSFQMGVSYKLKKMGKEQKEINNDYNNYIFTGVGLQYTNTNVPLLDGLGPQLAFGYGRHLSSRIALQLAMGYSLGYSQQSVNTKKGVTIFANTQYAFARGELVTKLYSTEWDRSNLEKDFSVSLVTGLEYGQRWKYYTSSKQLNVKYLAPTAGVNLKYHANSNYAIFVEPRMAYIEQLARYNVNAGIEYNLGKGVAKGGETFEPETSVALLGGVNNIIKRTNYKNDNHNISWGVAAEYQPYKVFGVRAMFDYSVLSFSNMYNYIATANGKKTSGKALWDNQYKMASLGLDFKIDLTNALYGYNPDRRWSSALYVGPVASKILNMESELSSKEKIAGSVAIRKKYNKDIHIGLHAGFNSSYALSDNFKLFTEVGARVYKNEILFSESLDYNPVKMLSFQIGVSYKIK